MRILHVVRNLEVGGLERFTVDLVAEQLARGHKVAICEVRKTMADRIPVPRGVQHFLPVNHSGKIRGFIFGLHVVKTFKPDVVHAHNTLSLQEFMMPCLCSATPMVMTKHGNDFCVGLKGLFYRFPGAIVCVSKPIRERLILLHPSLVSKSVVIPNGIGISEASGIVRKKQREVLGLASDVRAFVWVGRFVKAKSIDVMIEAFSNHKNNPDWKLFMIGDGGLRMDVVQKVQRLGLQSRVVFLGFRDDVRALMPAFDVFLLPSISEGLPIALLEAAGSGLPVIVSAVGDMPDVVCRQNGWVVSPGAVQSLTDCLGEVCGLGIEMLKDMGSRSKSLVEDKFSMSVCEERYITIYRQVTRSRKQDWP